MNLGLRAIGVLFSQKRQRTVLYLKFWIIQVLNYYFIQREKNAIFGNYKVEKNFAAKSLVLKPKFFVFFAMLHFKLYSSIDAMQPGEPVFVGICGRKKEEAG